MKKVSFCLIALLLAAACICVPVFADPDASAGVGENPFGGFDSIVASGTLNGTVNWKLDKTGSLTISGSGAMKDHSPSELPPWQGCTVKKVILGEKLTHIGAYAFSDCTELTQIIVPAAVDSIGSYAFSGCTGITAVDFFGNAPTFGECVFSGVTATVTCPGIGWNANAMADHGGTLTWVSLAGSGIATHPEDQAVRSGDTAEFCVDAYGVGLTFRWQYSKNNGVTWLNSSAATEGYDTNTLTVVGTSERDGFLYRCKLTDGSGYVLYSNAAALTVEKPDFAFISHPIDETVKLGNRAAFTVAAEGEGMVYQWQYQMVENGPWWNCTQYTKGYNTTELNVIAAEKRQGFLYRCRIIDAAGNKYYSNTAELTVDIPENYAVLTQPKDTWVMPGKTTTFHIDTQGEGLTFQWEYHKGVDKTGPQYYWIAMGSTTGCKTDTLTIAGISGSTNRDGWAYRCVVTDSDGYIYTTEYAFLYVASAQIDAQPEDANVAPGEKAIFHAEVSGEVAKYQWQYSKDGGKSWYSSSSATQGYNTDTLTVVSVSGSTNRNGFLYRCIIIDSEGNQLITAPAKLTVE